MKKSRFSVYFREVPHFSDLARLIRNREVIGEEAIDFYLNGTIADLYDGMLMKDMDKAVEILSEKIRERAAIRIIGDYDIDGVNATYILQEGLAGLGADVDTGYSGRIRDGIRTEPYLIDRALEDGIDTIITCDNGIAAGEEILYGKERGLTVIVTDHHEIPFWMREARKNICFRRRMRSWIRTVRTVNIRLKGFAGRQWHITGGSVI